MKKMKQAIILTAAILMVSAGISFAMSHGNGHSGHGSKNETKSAHDAHAGSAKKESGHGDGHMGMEMTEGMQMVGTQTQSGVKAMAHITDIRKAMAEAGMKQTHHFMVAFEQDSDGTALESGRVAVRIVSPSGHTSSAVALHEMDGHFGADVELSESGNYRFEVGSRVGDEQARQYEFEYEVK